MIFNSLEFTLFIVIFYAIYWLLTSRNSQNNLILFGSYIFYGWWDWRFLSLIIFSTLLDYSIGLLLKKDNVYVKKRALLITSILLNLSILGVFKYYNFFIESLIQCFNYYGIDSSSFTTLNIILPVGISFYTFQTLSYTIDVYRGKLKPTKNLINFAAFVSFFPQLVAGPIERAIDLLPQIERKREFNYDQSVNGIKLILWGLICKVVIADSLAPFVDDIFNNYSTYSGGVLLLGLIYFSVQIYCDFSGYSNIAIGVSKLLGINLTMNFNFPYFSRNIGEFWRRWHISLSSWFRDYLYIPLGGSRKGSFRSLINIFIVFTVSGFWHGANFTFIIWGLFHACLFIPSFLIGSNRKYLKYARITSKKETFFEVIKIFKTFLLVSFAWVFFRSENINQAFDIIDKIFTDFSFPINNKKGFIYVILIFVIEFILFIKIKFMPSNNYLRIFIYILITLIIIDFFVTNNFNSQDFIYFQF
ncbi:MBOAT family protein [Flavobacteriaceae bacterium]|nr:MBOAT family protein [Flavobacteriaceae bacterium]